MRCRVMRMIQLDIMELDLRNDNMIPLTPLPFVPRVTFRHGATPKNTERIGCTWWVLARRSRYLARTSLKVGIEALTAQGTCTYISTFLDVIARHDRVSAMFSRESKNMPKDSPHVSISLGSLLQVLINPCIPRRRLGGQSLIGQACIFEELLGWVKYCIVAVWIIVQVLAWLSTFLDGKLTCLK